MTRHARTVRPIVALAAAALSVGLCVSSASAQSTPANKPTAMTPPTPPASRSQRSPWLEYVALGVLGLLVVGVNCMPSKRGHQD